MAVSIWPFNKFLTVPEWIPTEFKTSMAEREVEYTVVINIPHLKFSHLFVTWNETSDWLIPRNSFSGYWKHYLLRKIQKTTILFVNPSIYAFTAFPVDSKWDIMEVSEQKFGFLMCAWVMVIYIQLTRKYRKFQADALIICCWNVTKSEDTRY